MHSSKNFSPFTHTSQNYRVRFNSRKLPHLPRILLIFLSKILLCGILSEKIIIFPHNLRITNNTNF